MDEKLILSLVKPFVKNDMLTYDKFDKIFGELLSRREQYKVVDVLFYNGIGLCDSHEETVLNTDDSDFSIPREKVDVMQIQDQLQALFIDPLAANGPIVQKKAKDIKESNEILCVLVQQGNKQAESDICVKNRALVLKIANLYNRKYPGNKLDVSDLEQAGYIGLLSAAKRYKIDRETAFTTYACSWIMQSITREIVDTGYTIRIPVHIFDCITRITRLESEYEYKGILSGDSISLIADELELDEDKVRYCQRIRTQYLHCVSLQTNVGDGETELEEFIPNEDGQDTESVAFSNIASEELHKLLNMLTGRERQVVLLRYGLLGKQRMTLEQIGDQFHLTRERIRQIEAKAIRKLGKQIKRKDDLYDLLEVLR